MISALIQFRHFVLLWALISFEAHAADIPSLVQRAKPAVVQVIASDGSWSPIRTGTGFFITPDGDLLTNFHVIHGATHISTRTDKGSSFVFERVIAQSADSDVALLKFQAADVDFLKIGTSANALEGETVLVIGNPEGLQGTVSSGIISAFRENRSYIQITAPISAGSSGSPVLDEAGQVIGMATLIYKEGQNLNFALSAEAIAAVIREKSDIPPGALPTGIAEVTPTPLVTTSPTPDEKLASDYYSKGYSESNEKNYQAAIKDYSEAVRLKPTFALAYINRGWAYIQLALYEQAVLDLCEAVRLQPKESVAYFVRGIAYSCLQRPENAISDYTAAIRLNPDLAPAYKNRGIVYDELKQYEQAAVDFSQAVRLEPDYAEGYMNLGNVYYKLRRYEQAIVQYGQVIRLKPDDAEAYNYRGQNYGDLKRYDKAIADFTEAIRLKPEWGQAFYNRRIAYRLAGRVKQAESDLAEAKKFGVSN